MEGKNVKSTENFVDSRSTISRRDRMTLKKWWTVCRTGQLASERVTWSKNKIDQLLFDYLTLEYPFLTKR